MPDDSESKPALDLSDLRLMPKWVADFSTAMVTGDARGDTGLDRQLFCGSGSQGAKERDNFPAFMLMSIIVALFMGLTVSAEEIIRDRKILKRESFLNLSWNSYLLSKLIILFAISAIQTFTFVLLGHLILEIEWKMLLDYPHHMHQSAMALPSNQ